jgi:GTP-binding protein
LTQDLRDDVAELFEDATGIKPMMVSAVSGEGMNELLRVALRKIREGRAEEARLKAPAPAAWQPE